MNTLTTDSLIHIFSLLDIPDVGKVLGVCREWNSIKDNELLYSLLCASRRIKQNPQTSSSWKDTLKEGMGFAKWENVYVIPGEIKLSDDGKRVIKLSHNTDCDIVFAGKPVTRSDVYMEFVFEEKGSEGFFGITTNPDELSQITGHPIIRHKDTWAYTCGSRHNIQLGGNTETAERFGLGDYIGVYLEASNTAHPCVSFFKNGKKQHPGTFPLPCLVLDQDKQEVQENTTVSDEKKTARRFVPKMFRFFAILDYAKDVIRISDWCYGPPPFLNDPSAFVPSTAPPASFLIEVPRADNAYLESEGNDDQYQSEPFPSGEY